MIRNPVKIGTITAAASSVLDLSIPVGHNGTICGLFFQCFASAGTASPIANVKTAIDKINLSVTHKTEGGFSILNDVTPTFLYFRELFYGKARGLAANTTGALHYDPSAAMRGGEAAQNIRHTYQRIITANQPQVGAVIGTNRTAGLIASLDEIFAALLLAEAAQWF